MLRDQVLAALAGRTVRNAAAFGYLYAQLPAATTGRAVRDALFDLEREGIVGLETSGSRINKVWLEP